MPFTIFLSPVAQYQRGLRSLPGRCESRRLRGAAGPALWPGFIDDELAVLKSLALKRGDRWLGVIVSSLDEAEAARLLRVAVADEGYDRTAMPACANVRDVPKERCDRS